jgi:SutA RNAP-binding domain
MRTTQLQDNFRCKERLRSEICRQIEEFLHNGGRIEVVHEVAQTDKHGGIVYRPATAHYDLSPILSGE